MEHGKLGKPAYRACLSIHGHGFIFSCAAVKRQRLLSAAAAGRRIARAHSGIERMVFCMVSILQQLYDGELNPGAASEHAQRPENSAAYAAYTRFLKKLDSALAAELEQMLQLQIDAQAAETRRAFIKGFRLGAQMMIEVLERQPT